MEEREHLVYLTEREVSALTGLSLSKLRMDRMNKVGIPYSKLGKSVRYLRADVHRYMEACRVETNGLEKGE